MLRNNVLKAAQQEQMLAWKQGWQTCMLNFWFFPHGSPFLLLPQEAGMVGAPPPGAIEMGH